ncbi:MAG: sigma-70 family RNA polymerase sigma factor [Hyphomicrobium sp.]
MAGKRSEPGSDFRAVLGPEQQEELALVAAVGAHDAAAFRALLDRHLSSVLATARRMLRDDAEAEDVAQEAMLRLWRSGGSVEIGPGGLRPWLRRVASNLCIDRNRSGRRVSVVDEVPEQVQAPEQFEALSGQDVSARVGDALKSLPDRQRQALTLFHYEGLSQVEIAGAMGISDEAVESLLARARRALRSGLENEWRELLADET